MYTRCPNLFGSSHGNTIHQLRIESSGLRYGSRKDCPTGHLCQSVSSIRSDQKRNFQASFFRERLQFIIFFSTQGRYDPRTDSPIVQQIGVFFIAFDVPTSKLIELCYFFFKSHFIHQMLHSFLYWMSKIQTDRFLCIQLHSQR